MTDQVNIFRKATDDKWRTLYDSFSHITSYFNASINYHQLLQMKHIKENKKIEINH